MTSLSSIRLLVFLLITTNCLSGFAQQDFDNYLQQISEKEKIDTLTKLSDFYVESNPDTSIYFANSVYEKTLKQNDHHALSTISKLLADAYYYKDDMGKAIEYYKATADINKAIFGEASDEYAEELINIGYCFYVLGVYDVAISYYESSLEIAQNNENMDQVFTNLNNIGTVYFLWGEYDKAVEAYDKTLEYDKQQNNLHNLSSSYNNIGKVYFIWGKLEKAIEYYSQSLEYARQVEDSNKMAIRYSNLGMAYCKLDKNDLAIDFLNKAIEIDLLRGRTFKVAIRHNEIGKILMAKGDYLGAKDYHLKAFETFSRLNILESKSVVLKDLGEVYSKLGNFIKAEESYQKAIAISQETGVMQNEMIAHQNLSELYEQNGRFEKSLIQYKLFENLNVQIFNKESDKHLSAFEVKYETEKKEIENKLLRNENEIKTKNQWVLIALVSVLFFSILLLVYFVRLRSKSHKQQKAISEFDLSKKEMEKQHLEDKVFAEKEINRLQKEKYNTEIKHKSSQLANSTLSLINKNEVLGNLKNEITALNGDGNDLSNIISYINHNLDMDMDWNKFKLEFDEAYPLFLERLHNSHPDLSETYIKICAYIRIDLTSREIADLLHVSQAAVNKNRQRLRKMLKLQLEADLGSFLKEL